MKAIVRDEYGDGAVLKLEDVDRPEPTADEVQIRLRASSLNRGDRYVLEGTPFLLRFATGLFRPKQRGLGMDFAGVVTAVGEAVTDVGVGDEVFGQVDLGETWAEYVCVSADLVAPKPANATFEQAGAVALSALTALQGLRAGGVQPGHAVLLNGSTGAVGPFAVQIAKALGAEVTAVCSERNIDLVRDLGADHVIPYERENFLACGRSFDVVFDIVGNHSVFASRAVLKRDGVFVAVGGDDSGWLGPIPHLLGTLLSKPFVAPRVALFTAAPNRADLLTIGAWIEAGQLEARITRSFPLEETAAALRFLAEARPPTKVVLTMS